MYVPELLIIHLFIDSIELDNLLQPNIKILKLQKHVLNLTKFMHNKTIPIYTLKLGIPEYHPNNNSFPYSLTTIIISEFAFSFFPPL